MRPEDLLRPEVLAAAPYHVPDAAGLIKLDAMENPHPLPEALRRQWAQHLAGVSLNRYPDANATELKAALRAWHGIGTEYDILPGNGSDEIIQMLTLALARPGAVAMAFEPSFVMYRRCAELAGMTYAGVTLAADFGIPERQVLGRIAALRPALLFVAQPNNPTGNACDPALLARLAAATPGVVVVDEAYHAFSGIDSLSLLAQHPNVLVMRTLSKLGLAGLRIGYLAGRPQWIAQLEKVRMPYNVGALAQSAASFLLRHGGEFREQARQICAERERLHGVLAAIPALQVWPSAANFLLLRVKNHPGPVIHGRLLEAGVLVKNLHDAHPLLHDCLRITVGTRAENDTLLAALHAVIA